MESTIFEGISAAHVWGAIYLALAMGVFKVIGWIGYPVKQIIGLAGDSIRSKREKYSYTQKETNHWGERGSMPPKKTGGAKTTFAALLILSFGLSSLHAQIRRPAFPIPGDFKVQEIQKVKKPLLQLQKAEVKTVSPGSDLGQVISGASNGDIISVNSGTYSIFSTITIDRPITIVGNGDVTILGPNNWNGSTSPYAESNPIFRITASGVTISGIKLNGQNRSTSQGLVFEGVSEIVLEDVEVESFKTMGIWFLNVANSSVRNVVIKDSGIGSSAYAGGAFSLSNISNIEFDNILIDEGVHDGGSRNGNAFKAMGIQNGYWRDITVTNSRFYVADFGTWAGGLAKNISVEGASDHTLDNVLFKNCYFNNNVSMVEDNGTRKSGFSVAFDNCIFDTRSAYPLELSIDDIVVQNSFLNGSGGPQNYDHQDQVEGLVFVNNVIRSGSNWSEGVFATLNGLNGATITNNTFENVSGSSLGVLAAKDQAFHENNTLTNNAFIGPYQLYAGGASGQNNRFENNSFSPNIQGSGDKPFPYYTIQSPIGFGAVAAGDPIDIDPDPIDPDPVVISRFDSIFINAGSDYPELFEGGRIGGGQDFGEGLFDTEIWGDFSVSIPLKTDTVTLTLFFKEIYWGAGGQSSTGGEGTRVFDVYAEDRIIIDDLDIYKEAGNDTLSRSFVVSIPDSTLDLRFQAVNDAAKISGIRVFPGDRTKDDIDPIDPIEPTNDSVYVEYPRYIIKESTKIEEKQVTIQYEIPVYTVDSVMVGKWVRIKNDE